jgi:hypothetical protein
VRGLRRGFALVTAVVAVCAGCTTVEQGRAVRDPQADPKAATVALLDPGNYPTKPRPPLGTAGNAYEGAKIESRRLSEYLVMPFQLDPAMDHMYTMASGVIKAPSALIKAFQDPVPGGAEGHNFVAGFTVNADTGATADGTRDKGLQNTIVRFATPADAAAAAGDMAARSAVLTNTFNMPPNTTRPIGIPRYPGTLAATYDDTLGQHFVLSYTAHGPYVLAQVASSRGGPDDAAALAAATLDLQGPLIDQFAATPVDQLAALPVDPTGLLARTLPVADADSTVELGTYGPHGALTFMTSPARDEKLFAQNGMVMMSKDKVNVYQARDGAAATTIGDDYLDEFNQGVLGMKWVPVPGVTGLPSAKCIKPQQDSTGVPLQIVYCVAAADKYVIEVQASQLVDAHQQVAAQYLMLTAK